jgi:hypothetical protein
MSGGDDTGDDNGGDGGEDDCGGDSPCTLCEASAANSSTSRESSRNFACRRAKSFSEHISRSARAVQRCEASSWPAAGCDAKRHETRNRFALVQLGIVLPRPRVV